MAKRKRLTPARPDFLSSQADSEISSAQAFASSAPPPIAQVAGDASATAALSEMSAMMAEARSQGRIIDTLKLENIDIGHLVRDRISADTDDMQTLIESLKARGQQVPIEVVDRGSTQTPQYGLISGWRRMAALKNLGADDVLAIVRHPQTSSDAYVAMVEENEIRANISFYERARIVVKSIEQGVYSDPKVALQTLFSNVSRAKRSKIKSFMTLVEHLDGVVKFPAEISERAGLELVKSLQSDASLASKLQADLKQSPAKTGAEEIERLLTGVRPVQITKAQHQKTMPTKAKSFGDVELTFDPNLNRVELVGASIDDDFVAELKSWIKAR